ncbi:MAG: hypothetical protein ACKPJJ_18135, partial [Planctomycetaceae bacterium]
MGGFRCGDPVCEQLWRDFSGADGDAGDFIRGAGLAVQFAEQFSGLLDVGDGDGVGGSGELVIEGGVCGVQQSESAGAGDVG